MKLLDKIEKFNIEATEAEENYKQWDTTRQEHQERMLEFIHKKMKEQEAKKADEKEEV